MFPNKFFRKHHKMFKTFFPNISGNYPEHCELFSNIFSLDTLKCFQTCSGTFWKVLMVHSEMFPNKLFRNLFFWTFLATIQNIVSCSQNIYSFDTIEIFTYLFWELFECLGTFWKVLMEHSEMFPNRFFRNILSLMEHSEMFPNKFFRNILKCLCSGTFSMFMNIFKKF